MDGSASRGDLMNCDGWGKLLWIERLAAEWKGRFRLGMANQKSHGRGKGNSRSLRDDKQKSDGKNNGNSRALGEAG